MNIKSLLLLVAAGALAFAGRSKLVHALTVTTGTWVGTPDE